MKRSTFIFLLTSLVVFYSCRSVKDLTYLQEVADKEIITSKKDLLVDYKVRPLDNLYVSIKTIDQEVNQLFSPSGQTGSYMTGTTQMFGDEVSQYINGYQLDPDGNIHLPIIGKVNVNGLTIDQAKTRIYGKALEYLKEPVVEVKLLSFRVNISGEVNRPGIYYHYQGKLSVLDAISMAGGITESARISDIMVIRQNENKTETYILDLTSKSFYESEAFLLYPYDMVYVKPGFNKKYELNVQTYQLILSTISTIFGLNFLYNNFRF